MAITLVRHFWDFFWGLFLLGLSLLVGVLGFTFIEGYVLHEAFYMAVITFSTVGFHEVRPLSDEGQVFTSIYILFNIGVFAYFLTVISKYVFEGELKEIFSHYISGRSVQKLNNHVIICGYGRNGFQASEEFRRSGSDFVVVDSDQEVFKPTIQDGERPTYFIAGDATQDEVLRKAGIERARAIICCLSDDAKNVFVALTARELNPRIRIVSRAYEASSESRLKRAGVDSVVMPDVIGGHYMATLVEKPKVIEFLDQISGIGNDEFMLEEFTYDDFKSAFKGMSIQQLDPRRKTGVTILGYKEYGCPYIFNPHSDVVLRPQEVFIVLGSRKEIDEFCRHYTHKKGA